MTLFRWEERSLSEIERRPCGLRTALSPASSSRCVPRCSGSPVNAVSRRFASIISGEQHQEASSRAVNSLSSASSRIAASSRSRVLDGVVAVIECHQRSDAGTTQFVTSYTPKPGPVLLAPAGLPGEHIPVAQGELSQTLTRRASSIASLRSVLTPVLGQLDRLRGCRDLHPMPRLVKGAGQAEPRGASLVGSPQRVPGCGASASANAQISTGTFASLRWMTSPVVPLTAAAATLRTWTSSPRLVVSMNTGAY